MLLIETGSSKAGSNNAVLVKSTNFKILVNDHTASILFENKSVYRIVLAILVILHVKP